MIIKDVAKRLSGLSDTKTLGAAIAHVLDLKGLSVDLVNALTEKATRQKDYIIDAMTKEFAAYLANINIAEETHRVLDGMTVHIQATFETKNGQSHSQSVKLSGNSIKKNAEKPKKRVGVRKRK